MSRRHPTGEPCSGRCQAPTLDVHKRLCRCGVTGARAESRLSHTCDGAWHRPWSVVGRAPGQLAGGGATSVALAASTARVLAEALIDSAIDG
jgi:hypothetical protein